MLPNRRKYLKRIIILLFIILFFICILAIGINNVAKEQKFYKEIKKAKYLVSNDNALGITYYVSSTGTSEDGTDINNPMSIETATKKKYYGNDRLLLKRGDTFYSMLNLEVNADENNLFYIGAYGDESLGKPIISGAAIIEDPNAWEFVNNNYRLDLSNHDYIKGFHENSGYLYNVGFIEDEKGNIYGNKKEKIEQLTEEYDFCCIDNYIYVKCSDNPIKLLKRIKLPLRHTLVKLSSNTIFENICIEDTGGHGIAKRNTRIYNLYINNCTIRNIGGSYIDDSLNSRYGNGIEFYDQSENTLVTNCIISNVYDAGYTMQGSGTIDNGFYNNVFKNNILINCTYPIELSTTKDDGAKFDKNIITDNIIINQGKCWGYDTRPDQFQAANIVVWCLPNVKGGLQFNNNKIYNSRTLYYYNHNEEHYKNIMNVNDNTYYLDDNTIYFANSEYHYDKDYLDYYGLDKDSSFITISDEDKEVISNEEILNSQNYEEIIEYYNIFEARFKSKDKIDNIIKKIQEIKNNYKYRNVFANSTVTNKIDSIISNLERFSNEAKISTTDNLVKNYNEMYDFIATIIDEADKNNIESFLDYELECIINDIDSISKDFEEVYSYYILKDTLSSNSVVKELNNCIKNYNTNISLNSNVRSILIDTKDVYIYDMQNKNFWINYLNKQRISNLCNIVNRIMKYNKQLEEEKSKIKVVYNQNKDSITYDNMIVELEHGDNTTILNNNGNNIYTFTKNGSFTFRLSIKGKNHALAISVDNIRDINSNNIRAVELNKKIVKSSKIEMINDTKNFSNNNFERLVLIAFLCTTVLVILWIKKKYKR